VSDAVTSAAKLALLARQLRADTPGIALLRSEPIAVVGIGCRIPGGEGPGGFWRMLEAGVDAITEIPADRWDVDAHFSPDPGAPGKMNTRWGSFLPAVDGFDAAFFGIARARRLRWIPSRGFSSRSSGRRSRTRVRT
jgi:hypothetical protein